MDFTPVEGRSWSGCPPAGLVLRRPGAPASWLLTPFENEEFFYREYLARQGVYAYLSCANKPEGCARLLRAGRAALSWRRSMTCGYRLWRLCTDCSQIQKLPC